MRSAILPAILLFGLAAGGLVLVRDHLATTPVEPGSVALAIEQPAVADAPPLRTGNGQAVIRKEANGHFWTRADVNGHPIRLMVDTGASVVVLTEEDARRAGLDPDSLPRTAKAQTAGGTVDAAPVTLKRIVIDGVEARNVQAMVMTDGLKHSLLGMSFLSQMSGWQVTEGAMVLRQ